MRLQPSAFSLPLTLLALSASLFVSAQSPPLDPLPKDHLPGVGYWENNGQACDLDQNPLPDIRFYSDGVIPKTCFMDGGHLGFVQEYLSPDTIDPDTLWRVDMLPVDAAPVAPIGLEASSEVMHFYFGHTMPNGAENVHRYRFVVYQDLWPGITMWIYPDGHKQRIAFACAPGSDPDVIKFQYVGQQNAMLDGNGNAILAGDVGELMMPAPIIYKVVGNTAIDLPETAPASMEEVPDMAGQEAVEYEVPEVTTDPTKPTVLLFSEVGMGAQGGMGGASDLCWSTYFGGNRTDWVTESGKDWLDNYYVTGHTRSAPFTFPGGPGGPNVLLSGTYYGTLSQFNNDERLMWTTMLGGGVNVMTYPEALAVRNTNSPEIYIGGNLFNGPPNFFTLLSPGSPAYFDNTPSTSGTNSFICRFNVQGQVRWSTYWGERTQIYGMAISDRRLVITGGTFVPLPTPVISAPGGATSWPPQATLGSASDAYVYAFDPLDRTNWRCYLGGSSHDGGYDVRAKGNSIYVLGTTQSTDFTTLNEPGAFNDNTFGGTTDAFLARFSNTYTCRWSTYFGGTGNDMAARNGLAVSPLNGDVYIIGVLFNPPTTPTGFPIQAHANGVAYFDNTTGPGRNGFIAHFKGGTDGLVWSSYFGNYDHQHHLEAITIGDDGYIYIGGETASPSLPIMNSNMFYYNQSSINPDDGVDTDGFVALLKPVDDVLEWSTYFGGNAGNLPERVRTLVAKENSLFAAGTTSKLSNLASYFPLQNNGIPGSFYDDIFGNLTNPTHDVFLTKFCTPWSDLAGGGGEKSLIRPNEPANSSFHVWYGEGRVYARGLSEEGPVQCFSADGRSVGTHYVNAENPRDIFELSLGQLVPGVYVLVGPAGERTKFVVQ